MPNTEDHSFPQPVSSVSAPIAEPIPTQGPESPIGLAPAPAIPSAGFPFPGLHLCNIDLKQGCYRIDFKPSRFISYAGTMRVENTDGGTIISGDLYRFSLFQLPGPFTLDPIGAVSPADAGGPIAGPIGPGLPILPALLPTIPVFPRNRYDSYLKVTNIQKSPFLTTGPCNLTLTIEQYDYTQPAAGSFDGSFPVTASRTVTVVLSPLPGPNPRFSGQWLVGGAVRGTFTMVWISDSFRRATLEIDTLAGAVAPQAVGSENFATVFATAGWDVNVIQDQTNVPVPAGVNANACWSDADLHALMTSVRNPTTDLDKEWHMHLIVVPATMGCGRGRMYDQIGVPREGVASFCNDGYPTSDSSNFGAAANQQQRNVPRAFLRSACHEVGHGFNQQHQEITSFGETGADNSIMTTTPSVADILGGPATGAPGVFPDNINLAFNRHVRHHLGHAADPVVRPGGMSFGAGHSTTVPQADIDRYFLPAEELELKLTAKAARLKLGEPLPLSWELTNKSSRGIRTPSNIGLKAQHAFISVVDPNGRTQPMPSFIISTDSVAIRELKPGAKLEASTELFWSSKGFAFKTPGRHSIEARIVWNDRGVECGVKATAEVFLDYPISEADNEVAAALIDSEVGKFIALGGGAHHLKGAVARIEQVVAKYGDHPACKRLAGYRGHKYHKAGA